MQVSEIRSRLIKRREQILEQRNRRNTSWHKLKEPGVEFEEAAAKEKMAEVFAQLDDREKKEIEQIDRALAKIRTGGFGMCESCGKQIAESRIKAIPFHTHQALQACFTSYKIKGTNAYCSWVNCVFITSWSFFMMIMGPL